MKKTQYMQFGKPVFALASLLQRKPWRVSFSQRPAFVPLAAAILLIFGLIFGSVGTVFAAQDSLPNDLLYSIKLTGENLQLAFTADTEARISLLTTFAGRRIEEATTLAVQGEPIPERVPALMDAHLEEIFLLTASMDDASAQEALKGIQIHLREQDQDMTNAMNGLPEGLDPQLTQLREMVKERQQLAQMGLGEPLTLQQQFQHQQGKPAPITTTVTTTPTVTITPTITVTPEITVTLTITPGHYGPGPCEDPGACIPPDDEHSPGPFKGTPPEDQEGYGPGDDQGSGPQQPPTTPKPGDQQEPKETPDPGGDDASGEDNGDNGSKKGEP